MPNNRSVGRPQANSGAMQARDVPVAHDKARLNDQRRVRPHGAGEPTMGVRPTGGHQTDPKKPALNKGFMQARDVDFEKMTEAEIMELSNPFYKMFRSKNNFIPGDAIGYNNTAQGIDLYIVRDGKVVGHKREENYETLTQKIKDLQQQRSTLSIRPKKAMAQMAVSFARDQGLNPSKVGQMGKEIPFVSDPAPAPAGARAPGTPPAGTPASGPSPASPGPAASPGPSPSPTPAGPGPSPGGSYRTTMSGSSSMGGPPMGSSGSASGSFGGSPFSAGPAKPASAPPVGPAGPAASEPAAAASGKPGMPQDRAGLMHFIQRMRPDLYRPGQIEKLSDYQLQRVFYSIVNGSETRGMRRARSKPQPRMAAEGYPDTSYERNEPSHDAKMVSTLNRTRTLSDPTPPDLNREFAQFRDLNVEKVHEHAEREMTDFLDRMTRRMGFKPLAEDDDSIKWHPGLDKARQDSKIAKKAKDLSTEKMRIGKYGDSKERPDTQVESKVSRTRARWV